MEFLDFSILSSIVEARKALTLTQIAGRVLGYPLGQIKESIVKMGMQDLLTHQQDGRDLIYGLTRKGLEAQQTYLYASKDTNDAAGIE